MKPGRNSSYLTSRILSASLIGAKTVSPMRKLPMSRLTRRLRSKVIRTLPGEKV